MNSELPAGMPRPSHLADPWTHVVTYLEMLSNERVLASGTGFFWRVDERIMLVTNWHNFAGKNPLTGDLLSESGAIPEAVRFFVFHEDSNPDMWGYFAMSQVERIGTLFDITGTPAWSEHPSWGSGVDVAALDVTELVDDMRVFCANDQEADVVIDSVVSQDLFVVGYPFGRLKEAPAPIWKRATLALDPNLDPEGLPKMLLDTASRPGMSGAIVLARHIVTGRTYRRKDGTESQPVLYGKYDTVIGIYSGRIYPHLEQAQLGVAWKRQTIEETAIACVRRTDRARP